MRKLVIVSILAMAIVMTAFTQTAEAKVHTSTVITKNNVYYVTVGTNVDVYKLAPVAIHWQDKHVKTTWSGQTTETVEASQTASISSAITATAGGEVEYFGTKASASIAATAEAALGVTASYSKSITISYSKKFTKKSNLGYYAYDAVIDGFEDYVQFKKVEKVSGRTVKNNSKTIKYQPRKNLAPTTKYSYYKSNPQASTSKVYKKIYKY